jgi:hypothetical protein
MSNSCFGSSNKLIIYVESKVCIICYLETRIRANGIISRQSILHSHKNIGFFLENQI